MNSDNPFPMLIMPVSAKLSEESVHEIHVFLKAFLSSFEREYGYADTSLSAYPPGKRSRVFFG